MKRLITLCLLGGCFFICSRTELCIPSLGGRPKAMGPTKNPVLYADYSDPDVCRVGDDYYLTSSSFNCLPGLQILHSKDLVNWTIIGAAVPYALPPVPMSVLNMATVYGHPVSATITVNSIYSGVTRTKEHSW